MTKIEYLIKTLSRTNRKDYENYVVNRIYHQLNDLDIKPVSQQYVKRKDGKYALIDLYFPQFNLGIECDECHHIQEKNDNGMTSDEMRTEDIMSAVKGYKERRIPIYLDPKKTDGKKCFYSVEEFNKRIDEIVNEIKELKEKQIKKGEFRPWTTEDDGILAKKQGFIRTSDNYYFKTNGEIRNFFGKGNSNVQRSYYPIGEKGYYLWLPHLSIEKSDKKLESTTNYGHLNLLSEDGKEVYEHVNFNDTKPNTKEDNHVRIAFAKARNNLGFNEYRFIGIFKKSDEIYEKDGIKFIKYKKFSDIVYTNGTESL